MCRVSLRSNNWADALRPQPETLWPDYTETFWREKRKDSQFAASVDAAPHPMDQGSAGKAAIRIRN